MKTRSFSKSHAHKGFSPNPNLISKIIHKAKLERIYKVTKSMVKKVPEYKMIKFAEDESRNLLYVLMGHDQKKIFRGWFLKQKIRVYDTQQNKLEFLFSIKQTELFDKIANFLDFRNIQKDLSDEEIIHIAPVKRTEDVGMHLIIVYNSGMRVTLELEQVRKKQNTQLSQSYFQLIASPFVKKRDGYFDPAKLHRIPDPVNRNQKRKSLHKTYSFELEFTGNYSVSEIIFSPWIMHQDSPLDQGEDREIMNQEVAINLESNLFNNAWSFPGGILFSKLIEGRQPFSNLSILKRQFCVTKNNKRCFYRKFKEQAA